MPRTNSRPVRKLAIVGVLVGSMALAGCSGLTVKTEEVERQKLRLEAPDPVKMRRVEWYVITPENQEEVFRRMLEAGEDQVLFGVSDVGYENLSKNLLDIRGYLIEQSFILESYKEYYESSENGSETPQEPKESQEKEETEENPKDTP